MVSIFFELLTSKKTAPSLIRVEKNFFKIGRKRYQTKWNFVLISKMCRTLASRSFKRFFLRKTIFCKISKSLKIQFFCKNVFPFANLRLLYTFEISGKFRFFGYPVHPILKKFFFQLL
jgi:hypothetical protein